MEKSMNWYKIAAEEKKPYRIYKLQGGYPEELLDIPAINAVNSEQARVIALKTYPSLRVFVEGALARHEESDIQARLDKERWEEILNYRRMKQERDEEKTQEAWWNK
jgi:hypothetical protein